MTVTKKKINKSTEINPNFRQRGGWYLKRSNRTVYLGTKVTPEFDENIRRLAHEKGRLITEMLEDFLEAYLEKEKKANKSKKKSK